MNCIHSLVYNAIVFHIGFKGEDPLSNKSELFVSSCCVNAEQVYLCLKFCLYITILSDNNYGLYDS